MPDLERELARYGTVLRDRAPAVRVDEVESRLHRPPTNHRPVRAAVAGAVLTLASVGLISATGTLIDVLARAPSTEAPNVATAAGGTSGPAVLAVVAGGGAVAILLGAAAVGLKRRHEKEKPKRLAKTRERRKKEMQTLERPVAPVERLERNNRFLIVGLVVAVLLAAGLGAWLIVDNAGTATEREITAFVEDYYAAWRDADGAAVLSMMTENAELNGRDGTILSGEGLASFVNRTTAFNPEISGDIVIIERPTTTDWLVASPTVASDPPIMGDIREFWLFSIVRQDGNLLIRYVEAWVGAAKPR